MRKKAYSYFLQREGQALLEGGEAEPMKKGRLGMKERELAGRGMEHNVDALAIGLPLGQAQGEVKIKMLAPDMVQLMLKGLLLFGGGEAGVDIDIKAAVIIGEDDALDREREGDEADVMISHPGAVPR